MRVLVAVLALLMAPCLGAQDLAVAAAADLAFCLPKLNAEFTREHPEAHVTTVTGSSGNFFTQIRNGAPFDVFLSADEKYAQQLAQAGQADAQSLTRYAVGQLVLWSAREDIPLAQGLRVVAQDNIHHVALANPEHAPYGRAGRSALQAAGLWDSVQPKLVLGENIAQTLQFAQHGSAEVGLIALSLVRSPQLRGTGHYIVLPQGSYPPITQAGIVTNHGKGAELAHAYVRFLVSGEAQAILGDAGFRPAAR